MDKQELLECIAPYLPYGVKCIMRGEVNNDESPIVATINEISKERDSRVWLGSMAAENYYSNLIEDVFPILRPLSDLTKSCLEGGKVPIEELENMFGQTLETNEFKHLIQPITCEPFILIRQLYKWHFDIHGLIDKKYAIDINTLNKAS